MGNNWWDGIKAAQKQVWDAGTEERREEQRREEAYRAQWEHRLQVALDLLGISPVTPTDNNLDLDYDGEMIKFYLNVSNDKSLDYVTSGADFKLYPDERIVSFVLHVHLSAYPIVSDVLVVDKKRVNSDWTPEQAALMDLIEEQIAKARAPKAQPRIKSVEELLADALTTFLYSRL